MSILFWGLTLFSLAFFSQLIVWKVHLPRRQIKVLLQIFCITLLGGLLTLWAASEFVSKLGLPTPRDLHEYILICLLFISTTLAYMITYSAIEVDSPSLVMIISISEAGPTGLSKEDFRKTMTDDLLIKPRVNDLLTDRMVDLNRGQYTLTTKGCVLARIFILYRRLLNAPKGG